MTKQYSSISEAFQTGAICYLHLNTHDSGRISVVLENEDGILLLKKSIFQATSYIHDKTGGVSCNAVSRRDYYELPYVELGGQIGQDLATVIAAQLEEKYGIEISGEVDLLRNHEDRKFAYFHTSDFTWDAKAVCEKSGVYGAALYNKEQLEKLFGRENAISVAPFEPI